MALSWSSKVSSSSSSSLDEIRALDPGLFTEGGLRIGDGEGESRSRRLCSFFLPLGELSSASWGDFGGQFDSLEGTEMSGQPMFAEQKVGAYSDKGTSRHSGLPQYHNGAVLRICS